MGETCATCRFWLRGSRFGKHTTAPGQWNGAGYDGDCRIRSVENFPRRRKDDWCGEHKPKDGADHG